MNAVAAVRPSVLGTIPSGRAGTQSTLRIMAGLVRRFRTDMTVRETALRLVSGLPNKDYVHELEAIRVWVRSTIRYTRDVRDVEMIHTPVAVLQLRQGDCDDQAVLLAALLESVGMRMRFVAVGPTTRQFVHVFAEGFIPRYGWVAAETTEQVPLGWRPSMRAQVVQEV